MASPLPPPREGRVRALIWLAFGDVLLVVCGVALILSPLLLAWLVSSPILLALLALPSLSWVIYGLMVLRVYATVPPAPVSNGIELDLGTFPALAGEIERLRLACDAPAFTAIYINTELNASIYQAGFRAGQSKHALVLGLPLLALLTNKQAAAVIAHEYAHISRQHGHFARWAYVARQRWGALGALHERNHRLITAPLRLFLSWYVPRMMRETLEFSRRCEVVADAQAMAVVGAEVAFETEAAMVLRQKAMSDQFWPGIFARAGHDDIAQAQPFTQLLTEPASSRPRDGAQAAVWLHESLCQKPDIHDTHPVFSERLAATGRDAANLLPDRLPWRLGGPSAASDWLQGEASGIAAQLDVDWREHAARGWQDAKERQARQHGLFLKLLQRRERSPPMNLRDFYIGLEFFADEGFRWRCTDTGSRTILAIPLTDRIPEWLSGPPYIVDEVVFDEREMERCYLTLEDTIRAAKHAHESSGHPGYSSEALRIMLEAEFGEENGEYPNPGVFRFDRCRADGEIFHPYAARRDGQDWIVLVHLPFLSTFEDVREADFISMRIASKDDVRARARLATS